MRTLYSARQQEAVLEAIEDWEHQEAPVFYKLTIGGFSYSDRLLECELGTTDGSPAISLDATLDGRLSEDLNNAPTRVWAEIDGIQIPRLAGTVTQALHPRDGFSTDFLSASPGALLDKVAMVPADKARNLTEYPATTHDRVIYDAVRRLTGRGGYRPGGARIPPFGRPKANYVGSEGFEDESRVKAVLDKVASEVMCVYRDGSDRSFAVLENPRTGEGQHVARRYDVDSRDVLEWSPPTLASPDEQYTEVVVRDRLDSGEYAVYARSEVSFYGNPYPPFPGQTFYVAFSDADPDKATNATQMARDVAAEFRNPAHKASVLLSYNPLIERGDVLRFDEDRRDDAGFWRMRWRAVVEDWADVLDEGGLSTRLSCRFYLLSRTPLRDPAIPLPGVDPGRVSAGVVGAAYGVQGGRLWVDPDRIVGEKWAGVEDGRLWVDPDFAPSGLLGLTDGRLYLDV